MHAVLTGAGFSKWAADLPLAASMFDFAVEPFGPRETRRLERVRRLKGFWDANHEGDAAELFVTYAESLGGRSWSDVVWYVVRRLAEPYIWHEHHAGRWRRHVLSIDEYRGRERPGVVRAASFLHKVRGLSLAGLLTTNYDMLVEYALGSRGFRYGPIGETLLGRGPYPVSQWRNPTRLAGNVAYSKLHGSMSWRPDGRFTDGRAGITGDALIVPPTPGKVARQMLPREWAVAERTLQMSDSLIVFGFAFNPYDEEILELLSLAGRGLRRVLLIDPWPPIARAKEVWPATDIDALTPEEVDGVARWLRIDHRRTRLAAATE